MEEKQLRLPLITRWFELTKAGVKTEDYREVNEYWYKKLVNKSNLRAIKKRQLAFWVIQLSNQEGLNYTILPDLNEIFKGCFQSFTHNIMTLGYPKSTDTDKILKLEHKGIEIRTGNPELGAEPNKLYFVIKHGEIIK